MSEESLRVVAVPGSRFEATLEFDGLASIVNSSLLGRIEEVWDSIEATLRHAFQFGKEKATDLDEQGRPRD